MRNIFFFIYLLILLTSCLKMPKDTYVSPLNIPADFDWRSIETKNITILKTSSILNAEGDTIASFIPPGNYDIIIEKNNEFTVKEENSSVLTKASYSSKNSIYFPAKNKYATVMFEDLFPSKGDMDVNDVVMGLNIEYYLDNNARLLAIKINIEPRAIGGLYQEIGLAANLSGESPIDIIENISSSTSNSLSPMFNVTTNKDGYSSELGIKNSQVIPLTGNFRSFFYNDKDLIINTLNSYPATETRNFSVLIELKSNSKFPISSYTFLEPPEPNKINLDIFITIGNRGKEIHFKGQRPTDKFSYQYFIKTLPKTDFSTIDNWVWAILSYKSIRHPLEYVKIYNAYPNFKIWAESGGVTNIDWYTPSVADSLYKKVNYNYFN